MEWITRTSGGLSVPHRPASEIAPHVFTTFLHACQAFGFLVQPGERLTALDWCERIESRYAPHHRRERVVSAIHTAMLSDERGTPQENESMPTLTDYATAGFNGEPNPHMPSSPAWYAHAIGALMQSTGRTAPRDVRMGRGYSIHCNDMTFREVGSSGDGGPTFERIA